MVSALPIWLKFYQGPEFTPLVKEDLMCMSSSTIDRYLKDYKKQFARRKRRRWAEVNLGVRIMTGLETIIQDVKNKETKGEIK